MDQSLVVKQTLGFFSFLFQKKVILASIGAGAINYYFQKYFFNDFQFLKSLIILIGIDLILDIWVLIIKKPSGQPLTEFLFSLVKTVEVLVIKIILYGLYLITIFTLTNFSVGGKTNNVFAWFDTIGYSSLIIKEALGIFKSILVIEPNSIPSWLVDKLSKFDETGNVDDLKPKKENDS